MPYSKDFWLKFIRPWERMSLFISIFFSTSVILIFLQSKAFAMNEYEIKAMFIKRFESFTNWPSNKFESDDSPIIISVIGDSPLKQAFEALNIDSFQNRKILFERVFVLKEELAKSHIVFISASETYRLNKIINILKGSAALTIGELKGFAENGGIINLVSNKNKIKFEINKQMAHEGGIFISSKVLNLASKVY